MGWGGGVSQPHPCQDEAEAWTGHPASEVHFTDSVLIGAAYVSSCAYLSAHLREVVVMARSAKEKRTRDRGIRALASLGASAIFGYWQGSIAAGIFMAIFFAILFGLFDEISDGMYPMDR